MAQLVRPRSTRTRHGALLVAVAATAAVTGCSTTSTGAGPTTSSTTGSTTSTSTASPAATSAPATPTSPTATATASTPTSTPSLGACTGRQLRVSAGTVSAGAGQRYVPLVFTNLGTTPCTLYGYPGVAGLDSAGHQLTQARRETGWVKATITLAPGGTASAIVHATVVPAGTPTCPPTYAALLVTPPNTTVAVRVNVSLPSCGGLTVRPVVAGTGGM